MSLVIVKAAHGIAISFKESITGYAGGFGGEFYLSRDHIIDIGFQESGTSHRSWVDHHRCAHRACKGRPAASASSWVISSRWYSSTYCLSLKWVLLTDGS